MNEDTKELLTQIKEEMAQFCMQKSIRPDGIVTRRGICEASFLWKHMEAYIDEILKEKEQ